MNRAPEFWFNRNGPGCAADDACGGGTDEKANFLILSSVMVRIRPFKDPDIS
jgi:hypothetical protein